jgi:hypothetical protein
MHATLKDQLSTEREQIIEWLRSRFNMPLTVAVVIADQHRLGGELISFVPKARPPQKPWLSFSFSR